jgi:hypothetical protein
VALWVAPSCVLSQQKLHCLAAAPLWFKGMFYYDACLFVRCLIRSQLAHNMGRAVAGKNVTRSAGPSSSGS